jgi:hypothetical protein
MPKRPRPDPDESPGLVPPSRRPPTAVGTATPPPPRRHARESGGMKPVERVAAGLLGVVTITAGVAICTLAGAGLVIGPLLAGAGANALCRGLAGRGLMAESRAWRRRRRAQREAALPPYHRRARPG